MTALYWVMSLVIVQRLIELAIARRNTARLLAVGGVEHGARHYPLLVGLHVAWLFSLLIFVPADQPPHTILIVLFLLLQLVRVWVIASLGERWTTRVITIPDRPLVRRGPYQWMKHPNYAVVVLEILLLPLAFDAHAIAIIFSLFNAAVLFHRIRVENAALASNGNLYQ